MNNKTTLEPLEQLFYPLRRLRAKFNYGSYENANNHIYNVELKFQQLPGVITRHTKGEDVNFSTYCYGKEVVNINTQLRYNCDVLRMSNKKKVLELSTRYASNHIVQVFIHYESDRKRFKDRVYLIGEERSPIENKPHENRQFQSLLQLLDNNVYA